MSFRMPHTTSPCSVFLLHSAPPIVPLCALVMAPKRRIVIPHGISPAPVAPKTLKPGKTYTREDVVAHADELRACRMRTRTHTERATVILQFPHQEEQLHAIPGFGKQFTPVKPEKYRLKGVNAIDGVGMFAAEEIPAGEVIIRERPFIAYPTFLPHPRGGYPTAFLSACLEELSKKDQRKLIGLAKSSDNTVPTLVGICSTNAFQITKLPRYTDEYSVVCDDISRANHRCAVHHMDGIVWHHILTP